MGISGRWAVQLAEGFPLRAAGCLGSLPARCMEWRGGRQERARGTHCPEPCTNDARGRRSRSQQPQSGGGFHGARGSMISGQTEFSPPTTQNDTQRKGTPRLKSMIAACPETSVIFRRMRFSPPTTENRVQPSSLASARRFDCSSPPCAGSASIGRSASSIGPSTLITPDVRTSPPCWMRCLSRHRSGRRFSSQQSRAYTGKRWPAHYCR